MFGNYILFALRAPKCRPSPLNILHYFFQLFINFFQTYLFFERAGLLLYFFCRRGFCLGVLWLRSATHFSRYAFLCRRVCVCTLLAPGISCFFLSCKGEAYKMFILAKRSRN